MQASYLAHHGVKGMKWGVRKDRRAANRARKKAERDIYKAELKNPGSHTEKQISSEKLRRKRLKNIVGTVLLGREAVTDLLSAGALGAAVVGSAATAAAEGYGAAAIATALGPAALAAVATAGVGAAAARGAYATAKRANALDESVDRRERAGKERTGRAADYDLARLAKRDPAHKEDYDFWRKDKNTTTFVKYDKNGLPVSVGGYDRLTGMKLTKELKKSNR